MASTDRFGYEWNKYSGIDPVYESQLLNWINPLKKQDFNNKSVLDAGCGMGRNSYWCLQWGAKDLVAFDADDRSVAAARKNLSPFPNARVEFKSIYDCPWRENFDIAFSIGVIHHLENPALALQKIVAALKPGGTLIVWVYSYEGNEWITKYVDPVRKSITSKLPVWLVHYFSYGASVPLWLFVKIFPVRSGYLKQISKFKFWHIHSIVFDQLLPTIAHYWKRSEVEALAAELPLTSFTVNRPPNNSGWTLIGTK